MMVPALNKLQLLETILAGRALCRSRDRDIRWVGT